ncbi:MAG TPA: hypothetical protein VGR28_03690 [Candidatus Thermoplasmatota archaeon]|jgi:hypothetical protein|nr:hypothetical protein [Candidatus Thermoplasmatota archaeon]
MKANRAARARASDEGLAAIVGVVLMAGIALIVLATVRLYWMPAWERDAEAAHMAQVGEQMSAVRLDLDRLAADENRAPVAVPVSLSDNDDSMLAQTNSASLSFEPGINAMRFNATEIRLLEQNGTDLTGINENWNNITAPTNISLVGEVISFRLKIDSVGPHTPGSQRDVPWSVVVSIYNANGTYAGDFNFTTIHDCAPACGPEFSMYVKVRDASNETLYNQAEALHLTGSFSPYWVNLLNTDFRFDRVIAATDQPMRIFVEERGLNASYAITYTQDTAEGTVIVGGGGLTQTPFVESHTGGRLRLLAENTHYLRQQWIVENGAVILDQGDGAVFKVAPHFDVGIVANKTYVIMSMPTLTGASGSLAGKGTMSMYLTQKAHASFHAEMPAFTLNVTTSYPSLWRAFWEKTLNDAGLTAGAGNLTLASGANWTRMVLYGVTAAPGSSVYDLDVTFAQADVDVALRR